MRKSLMKWVVSLVAAVGFTAGCGAPPSSDELAQLEEAADDGTTTQALKAPTPEIKKSIFTCKGICLFGLPEPYPTTHENPLEYTSCAGTSEEAIRDAKCEGTRVPTNIVCTVSKPVQLCK